MKQNKQYLKPSIRVVSIQVQDIIASSTMSVFGTNATHYGEEGIEGGNGGDGL